MDEPTHAYSDNPDRDSLDGNLPSSSHGTATNPPPAPPLGPLATPASFTKGPNAKKKHKKLKADDTVASTDKEKTMKRQDSESGDSAWEETEPCTHMWVVLSSMYGKLVVLLTIAFCLTEVMDNSILPLTFQGVFMMYLYVGSIIAILCIYITVVADNIPSVTSSKQDLTQADPDITSLASFGTLKRAHISRSKTTRTSFYLRVGALLFGFGTLVFNGLEIAMRSTTDTACSGELSFAHPILQAIFTFLQMHFLFVNSEVVVEKFGQMARFGFIHLVATNLSVWFRMVIWDSAHEWVHFVHLHAQPDRPLQYGGTPSPSALRLQGFPGLKDLGYEGYLDVDVTTEASPVDRSLDLGMRDSGVLYYGNPFTSGAESVTAPCVNGSLFSFTTAHAQRVMRLYQCYNNNTLGQMWTKSMPYLFPFIVEYSLIAAAVTYIMWKSVGRERSKQAETKKADSDSTLDSRRRKQWRTDCRAASKGLFLGLLCLVGGIVVLIIFFVMKDTTEFQGQMFWLSAGTQLVVLSLSVVMTLVGFYQVPKLSVTHKKKPLHLDSMLSSVTIVGVYLLGIFGLIVGGIELNEPRHLVLFVLNVTLIVQTTCQGMLVSEASRRQCATRQQQMAKPGRQVITFLLFSNVTLWMMDTFMSHHWLSQEMQFNYYGFLAWGIISRISLPLMIFYRFHQSVILVEIWKNTYKTRSD
ncbi:proton channel OtopLc-like isoform X2 [Amphibalanus amphitrite]|uniref:proton channel OtopLc-like isoform X2 n=1 Tax=Amphibalanus amphitrite TaxID=1232801 RepID=UPI001C9037D8|nr:proton channel OtopLc-like isoform X2 [Amphibalanus amphitrite]XP_043219610.1 proton channel OtopLc-like isoform X2 [Amphibalanus amphitrite]